MKALPTCVDDALAALARQGIDVRMECKFLVFHPHSRQPVGEDHEGIPYRNVDDKPPAKRPGKSRWPLIIFIVGGIVDVEVSKEWEAADEGGECNPWERNLRQM